MAKQLDIVPVNLINNSQDCVLEVEVDKEDKSSTEPRCKCHCDTSLCGICIFLLIAIVVTLFALLFGAFLYAGFHSEDYQTNIGVAITYGYAAILLMFISVYVCIRLCCPKLGQTKIKALR